VGISSAVLGGEASNAYVELGRLQQLSGREGRVNGVQVRADSADDVTAVADQVNSQLPGAEVVTASDLADRVGGSLNDANNLSSKLGAALAIVALLAAFLIATLLTLSSVQKRIRELGTLKALGWRQRLVVRQVTGESLVQGALGGLIGGAIGIAAATLIDAIGPTLETSVQQQASGGFKSLRAGSRQRRKHRCRPRRSGGPRPRPDCDWTRRRRRPARRRRRGTPRGAAAAGGGVAERRMTPTRERGDR
jgi:ABC-type lipoprotein release transport system permease subunit